MIMNIIIVKLVKLFFLQDPHVVQTSPMRITFERGLHRWLSFRPGLSHRGGALRQAFLGAGGRSSFVC